MNPDRIAERRRHEQQMKERQILADRKRNESLTAPKNGPIRKVNFDDFKNHYGPNHHDAPIEVLVANGPDLMSEIRGEMELRKPFSHHNRHGFHNTIYGDEVDLDLHYDTSNPQYEDQIEKAEVEGEIQRVRIHSLPVLACLTFELNIQSSWYWPRTFFRPFKALVFLQPILRKRLAKWESQWPRNDTDQNVMQSIGSSDSKPDKHKLPIGMTPEADVKDNPPKSSIKASPASDNDRPTRADYISGTQRVDALRPYLDFVDREIMPFFNRFENAEAQSVAFDDLWSLFRLGELVYVPSQGKPDDCYHEVWRLYRTKTSPPVAVERDQSRRKDGGWPRQQSPKDLGDGRTTPPPIPLDQGPRRPPPPPRAGPETLAEQDFTLYGYYIDHDGHALGAVRQKFTIHYFPGERAIDSLEIFPLRFLPDCANKKASLKAQGQKFLELQQAGRRYKSYNAWTLIRNPPCDEAIYWQTKTPIGPDGEPLRHPEFVESNVIIDAAEAFQTVPSWKPKFHKPTPDKTPPVASDEDRMSIRHWKSRSRDVMFFERPEIIQTEDGIEILQRNLNLKADSFLKSQIGGHRSMSMGERRDYTLNDEDLMLLPKRVFAYALRDRKFVIIDLHFLEDIKHDTKVFDNLQIPAAHKTVVKGLVSSHFEAKELEQRLLLRRRESINQDLVQGKGKGLVMLLHGPPGVGKTATAEAVAMENRKPLFVMTCGDLGLTPTEIERSLTRIFRLAHLWECVLLLDEADVFLTQRLMNDMTRNAMVSVFLRVLEYYNGLLFLTTNRVGTIDEAFKSRIHMSLYYKALSEDQTLKIFGYNLGKLQEIENQRSQVMNKPVLAIQHADILDFAQFHFRTFQATQACWNGRQIRNAFQIASSLAHHEYARQCEECRRDNREAPAGPVLHQEFFHKVQTATQEFNDYMKATIGFTDAAWAHMQQHRQDDFVPSAPQQQPMATQMVMVDRSGIVEYRTDNAQYAPPSASPQPDIALHTSQYSHSMLAQNPGQTQYHGQSAYPTSILTPQAHANVFPAPRSYIPTQMDQGQRTGYPAAQTHAQPPAQQPQLYAQQPIQKSQTQGFGQYQTSTSQPMHMYVPTHSQPQESLYHQLGRGAEAAQATTHTG